MDEVYFEIHLRGNIKNKTPTDSENNYFYNNKKEKRNVLTKIWV